MKLQICLMGMLCLFFQAKAQPKTTVPYLTIGDQMPDVPITNIINSDLKDGQLTDYKGKLILLDFWSTTCSACIQAFPEMDALQKQFPKDLQILLVNYKNKYDTDKRVKTVIDLTTEVMGKPFRMPIVRNDTNITRYFEFNTIPHCVWIGPKGTIVAITGKSAVTAANIAKVLRGEPVNLPLKTIKNYQ